MASGDTLLELTPHQNDPPSSNAAAVDTRTVDGTPIMVLDYDPSTSERATFGGLIMPQNYSGATGITVVIKWTAAGATSGDVKWDVAFCLLSTDVDTDTFASVQSTTTTTSGTDGGVNSTTITFTDGAQIDSVTAGDLFAVFVERDSADAADTMNSNDAEFWCMELRDT